MRSFVGTLLVTITCIVSVYSLKCMKCENSKDLHCSENVTEECHHSEDTCATSYYGEWKGKDKVASWVKKGCKKSLECTSSPATLSNLNVAVAFGVACCKTDSCPVPAIVFPNGKNKNNLTCTSCYSTSRFQCDPQEKIMCSGNETKCGHILIDSIGHVNEHWSMRGCATEEFCSHNLVTPGSINLMLSRRDCTDSSSTLTLSILTLTLAIFGAVLS